MMVGARSLSLLLFLVYCWASVFGSDLPCSDSNCQHSMTCDVQIWYQSLFSHSTSLEEHGVCDEESWKYKCNIALKGLMCEAEVTEAEVTDVEVTETEVTEAEVMKAEVTEAEVTETEVTEVEVTEVEVTETEVTEAEVMEAEVAEAEVMEVEVTETEVTEAEVTEAEVTEAEVTETTTEEEDLNDEERAGDNSIPIINYFWDNMGIIFIIAFGIMGTVVWILILVFLCYLMRADMRADMRGDFDDDEVPIQMDAPVVAVNGAPPQVMWYQGAHEQA